VFCIEQRLPRQHFHGDVAAERFLIGLVNDAHAAAADFAENAEIAESLQLRRAQRNSHAAGFFLLRFEMFDGGDRRENIANILGEIRISRRVLGDRGRLPAALALDEFGGQEFQRIAIGILLFHVKNPSK
jgi:hypothetical protein